MPKILSFAKRQAQTANQARQASHKKKEDTTSDHLSTMSQSLLKMGFKINDEPALKEIIAGGQTKISLELIALLKEKQIISYIENSNTAAPQPQQPQGQSKSKQKEKNPPKKQQTQAVPAPQTQDQKENTAAKPAKPRTLAITEAVPQPNAKKKEPKEDKNKKAPQPEKQNTETWEQNYINSLTRWCETTLDKKTNQPKREVTETKVEENKTTVTIKPVSPIAKKRGDKGAVYEFTTDPKKETVNVTLGSPDNRPLNYDYFYALVKTAVENGIEVIEFKNITTPEFRDKLLAAALQFKQKHKNLKLKNAPGAINLDAEHLKFMPPKARENLATYNECVKKALKERGKEILPEKGAKYGEGPRAEERSPEEIEAYENKIEAEKDKRYKKKAMKVAKNRNLDPKFYDYLAKNFAKE